MRSQKDKGGTGNTGSEIGNRQTHAVENQLDFSMNVFKNSHY